MGVEPTGDRSACHPPVLKTGTITGPHALPRGGDGERRRPGPDQHVHRRLLGDGDRDRAEQQQVERVPQRVCLRVVDAHADLRPHLYDSGEFGNDEPLRIAERDATLPGSKIRWRYQVAQSRQTINEQIRKLRLTRIIVAHRPETIATASRVLSMLKTS